MNAAQAPTLRWAPLWAAALVALWPLPMAAQALLSVGALAGAGWLLLRRSSGSGALLSGPAWALTSVLFCAFWLPEAVAALDAEGGWVAWRAVLVDLRLLPLLWLAAAAVADPGGRRRVFAGLALVALAWALDLLISAASGGSLLHGLYARLAPFAGGLAQCPPEATPGAMPLSAFAGCGAWQGLALACLSPFALAAGARRGHLAWLTVALVMTAAVALSAAVMAWIACACVLLLELRRRPKWQQGVLLFAAAALGIGLAALLATRAPANAGQPRISAAHAQTALEATAGQWRDALCVARGHALNGVGAGGLEPALRDCPSVAGTDDASGIRALPLPLEVFAETGAAGLLLWLAGIALAWRAWRYADTAARARAWPALQALLALLFPLNASLPVYAGLWGSALLLLAGLYAGALWGRIDEATAPQS
ncbi:O-antigen ligase family protein [Thermomonas sp.]|uniref:O-antigen ligase family protein n=1 Tax=Thermomonas sp. TaxID=1971895 RepID=UPI002618976B|nr:O-antigen ligase family protein [Thermomonas sp.]